jgi:ribosomal protein S5
MLLKAKTDGRKNIIKLPITKALFHMMLGDFGACSAYATFNRRFCYAGGAVRIVLEVAGVKMLSQNN